MDLQGRDGNAHGPSPHNTGHQSFEAFSTNRDLAASSLSSQPPYARRPPNLPSPGHDIKPEPSRSPSGSAPPPGSGLTTITPVGAKPKPSQSCDGCRHRKIRCVWTVPLPDIPGASAGEIQEAIKSAGLKCVRCTDIGMACEFRYEVKKRGPPKGFVRKSKQAKKEELEGPTDGGKSPRSHPRPSTSTSAHSDPSSLANHVSGSQTALFDSSTGRGVNDPYASDTGGGSGMVAWGPTHEVEAGGDGRMSGAQNGGKSVLFGNNGRDIGIGYDGAGPSTAYDSGFQRQHLGTSHPPPNLDTLTSLDIRSDFRNGSHQNPLLDLPPLIPHYEGRNSPIFQTQQAQQLPSPASVAGSGTSYMSSFAHPPSLASNPISLSGGLGPSSFMCAKPPSSDHLDHLNFLPSASSSATALSTPPIPAGNTSAGVGKRSVALPGGSREDQPGYGPLSTVHVGKSTSYVRLRLEDVMTRGDAKRICELYIDFIWHLIPCLHIPSFRADFTMMRDRHDPTFLALVFSVIGVTFVLVPRQWLPESILRREDFRRTVTMVLQASEDILDEAIDTGPAILILTCHYLNMQTNHQLGRRNKLFVSIGQCFLHVTSMRLFEPGSYLGLNVVEREMRKRLYWLCHGMDKSKACLADEPMMLRTSEYGAIDFPDSVDDSLAGGSPEAFRAGGPAPAIAGFIHVSRLFAILEEVLGLYRHQRHCLSRSDTEGTLLLLSSLLERCQTEMVGCVVELKLKPNRDQNQHVPGMDALYGFFSSPTSSIRGKSFLVAQANIYVTQQWIRYLILQCRLSLIQQLHLPYAPDPRYPNESLEVICQDLLHILCSLPIECIATNGLPLIEKVRYIAAGLLNVDSGHASLEVSSPNQSILMDFLVLMSEIERKYAM